MSELFADTLEGGCNCGAVRYTLSPGFRIGPYACHCTLCQTRTGSAFAEHILVTRAAIAATDAETVGVTTNPSGAKVTLYGCSRCGARLWGENDTRAGVVSLRCGTLDRSREVVPRAHLWIGSKQPWIGIADGVPQLEEQPRSNDEWMQLLGAGV